MIMSKPELYENSNGLSKKDTLIFLEKYAKTIKWKSDDTIIDIGCGDGGTTGVVLKKYIPLDYKKLVGCDKSEIMVNYANQHHRDERTSFILLDIEEELPKELNGSFNHVFSFFLLNWIHDIETAFSNIYKLLSDGGDCLHLLVSQVPVYDVFEILSTRSKWGPYLSDIQDFLPVYYNIKDQKKIFSEIMEKTGFKNVEVKLVDTTYTYQTIEYFKKFIDAVNPFEIPPAFQEEFLTDYVKVAKEVKNISIDSDGIHLKYSLIETYGTK